MSAATAEATKTKTSAGLFVTILGLLVLIIPWLCVLYAQLTGNVTLTTSDAVSLLVNVAVIVTGVALGLGLIATLLNILALMDTPRRGIVSIIFSLLTLIAAAVLLLTIVLPRASSVKHLHDDVIPFARGVSSYCKTPLDNTTNDFNTALSDAQSNVSNDSGFAQAMTADATKLQSDEAALIQAVNNLSELRVPDAKYQSLLDDCIQTEESEIDFLSDSSGPNAIPLPAPFNAQIPSVSGIGLLDVSALVASGQSPLGTLPSGTVEPLVVEALKLIVNTTNPQLTAEGQALAQDITDTLNTNLTPFKVAVPSQ